MSFQKFCGQYSAVTLGIAEEVGRKKAITLVQSDHMMTYSWNTIGLSPKVGKLLKEISNETSNVLEMFLLGETFSHGPKVFDVGQIDIEALICTDINVPISEYVQPFPTMVVQFPPDFCKNRSVSMPQGGEILFGQILPNQTEPDFAIIHHDPELKTVIFALFFDTGVSIKGGFSVKEDQEIQDILEKTALKPFRDSMFTSVEEQQLFDDLFRACMNYCLLINEFGIKRVGYVNPKYADKLRKSKHESNQRQLRLLPIQYTLNQEVKLFRTVNSESDLPSEPTGKHLSAHYRRGHYRMQPCGVGLKERKRVRIAPIFVNSQFFLGKKSDTKVSYK